MLWQPPGAAVHLVSASVCQDCGVHELALLHSVVQVVEKAAHEANAPAVTAVGLRVGSQSGAVAFALEGAWPIATAGTSLEGARLELELVQAAIWCPACKSEREIDEFYALTCPVCGTPSGALTRGREFEVTFAELPEPG